MKKPRSRAPTPPASAPEPEVRSGPCYQLQLYVTGTTARSLQAVANLRALCEEHLAGRYELEVIDMYQQPGQAAVGQIIAAPTLIKKFPAPLIRMVGNLANREQLLVKLNLAAASSGAAPSR
jgi:circadian clock protein KaiB